MKVVHVVEPFSSGIVTFIINITRELSEHEHLVIHGKRTTEDDITSVRKRFDSDVSFKLWKYANKSVHPVNDFLALIQLYKMLKNIEFDVLHLHSSKAGFLGKMVAWLLGAENVVYTPNAAPFIRTDITEFQRRVFIHLEKFSANLIGKVVSCGRSEAEVYQKVGIRTDHINNGITISPFPVNLIRFPLVIGCGAIITRQKNPKMFSEIATAFARDPRLEFRWIGDGSLRAEVNEEAVKISCWLDSAPAQREISSIDIYVSTAQWEGQPFAVLEAMNMGKCLVLSDCHGNRDLVEEGRNGFLFKTPDEAIRHISYLMDNPDLIRTMGIESYLMARERHNIEDTARQYLQVYEELAQRK